jgi:hypothetical protein
MAMMAVITIEGLTIVVVALAVIVAMKCLL